MKPSLDYNITERNKYKEQRMMAWKISEHDRHMHCSYQKITLACAYTRKKEAKRFLTFVKDLYPYSAIITITQYYILFYSVSQDNFSLTECTQKAIEINKQYNLNSLIVSNRFDITLMNDTSCFLIIMAIFPLAPSIISLKKTKNTLSCYGEIIVKNLFTISKC